MPAFGNRLRAVQEAFTPSVSAFIRALPASRQSVYDWFKAEAPTKAALGAVLSAFPDVDPAWLETGEGEMLRARPAGAESPEARTAYADYIAAQRAASAPEPLAPPGVVLVLVLEDADGEPIYGMDHKWNAHQLGRAIRCDGSLVISIPRLRRCRRGGYGHRGLNPALKRERRKRKNAANIGEGRKRKSPPTPRTRGGENPFFLIALKASPAPLWCSRS